MASGEHHHRSPPGPLCVRHIVSGSSSEHVPITPTETWIVTNTLREGVANVHDVVRCRDGAEADAEALGAIGGHGVEVGRRVMVVEERRLVVLGRDLCTKSGHPAGNRSS